MRPDISKWLEKYYGRGLSPAAGSHIAKWWTQNFTKIAKGYRRGGVAGRDTVPAMLTPGEIVLNASQQKNLAAMIGVKVNSPADLFARIEGARGQVSIEQNNTFNELPKDKYRYSDQMKRAAAAGMG